MDPYGGRRSAAPAEPTKRLLVIGRIGAQRYAWPAASVERVLPMAAVSKVADLPFGVAGLMDVHGEVLAVVDPRPRLGLPPQAARPEQHLLLLRATERFLLWVDCVETIVAVDADAFEELRADTGLDAPLVTRVDGELVQVLSATVFDPGHVVLSARGAQ